MKKKICIKSKLTSFFSCCISNPADYNKCLPLDCVLTRWDSLCLDCRDAELILKIGRFKRKCQIKKFLSIGTGLLTRSITETMIMICELFTHEPDGGSAMIPLPLFMELYGYGFKQWFKLFEF